LWDPTEAEIVNTIDIVEKVDEVDLVDYVDLVGNGYVDSPMQPMQVPAC
jgi:hypothetical protein